MNLPEKTFLTANCQLFESDFEFNGQAKPARIMQLMQDAATSHAEQLGVGWHALDQNGMLWVLSKVKTQFFAPVTRQNAQFTLYTWPLAPNRFYAERCFAATKGENLLFSTTSLWTIISRDERKIVPGTVMNDFYHGEYSSVPADAGSDFARVRWDSDFRLCYQTTIRRSDLDQNGHVNNTNYVGLAEDVLPPQTLVSAWEIVYHKELKLGDVVDVWCKEQGKTISVVGRRGEETCFTALFTVEE